MLRKSLFLILAVLLIIFIYCIFPPRTYLSRIDTVPDPSLYGWDSESQSFAYVYYKNKISYWRRYNPYTRITTESFKSALPDFDFLEKLRIQLGNDVESVSLSPSGQKLLFIKARMNETWDSYYPKYDYVELWYKEMDTGKSVKLSNLSRPFVPTSVQWLKDEKSAIFTTYSPDRSMFYIDIEKRLQVDLLDKSIILEESPPTSLGGFYISPDENWVAFDTMDSSETKETKSIGYLYMPDIPPFWSKDGNSIYYIPRLSNESELLKVVEYNINKDVTTTILELSNLEKSGIGGWAKSPDDKFFIFSDYPYRDSTKIDSIWLWTVSK